MTAQSDVSSKGKSGNDFLGVQGGAEYMAVSDKFMWNLIYKKEIPSYRFGRAVRLRKADLDNYIASSLTPAVR